MKKLILALLYVSFNLAFASCERVYECVCTYDDSSTSSTEFVVLEPESLTRSEAKAQEAQCEDFNGANSIESGVQEPCCPRFYDCIQRKP